MILRTSFIIFLGLITHSVSTEYSRSFLKQWSENEDYKIQEQIKDESLNVNDFTPLDLVLLPDEYDTQRCLDGTPFGYYIRRNDPSKQTNKWIVFLQGGGLCVEPIDCINRKNSDRGSSSFWETRHD